jgi:hypothetical protein
VSPLRLAFCLSRILPSTLLHHDSQVARLLASLRRYC